MPVADFENDAVMRGHSWCSIRGGVVAPELRSPEALAPSVRPPLAVLLVHHLAFFVYTNNKQKPTGVEAQLLEAAITSAIAPH